MVSACATTCAQSAICGSARGDTNEPTSISRSPACASAAIQRCLSAVGMMRLTLCRPSRGPTSLTNMSMGAPFFGGIMDRRGSAGQSVPARLPPAAVAPADAAASQRGYFSLVSAGWNHCRACTFFICTGSMNGNTVLLKAK